MVNYFIDIVSAQENSTRYTAFARTEAPQNKVLASFTTETINGLPCIEFYFYVRDGESYRLKEDIIAGFREEHIARTMSALNNAIDEVR